MNNRMDWTRFWGWFYILCASVFALLFFVKLAGLSDSLSWTIVMLPVIFAASCPVAVLILALIASAMKRGDKDART